MLGAIEGYTHCTRAPGIPLALYGNHRGRGARLLPLLQPLPGEPTYPWAAHEEKTQQLPFFSCSD